MIDAFRAGGVLTEEKKSILESIRKILNISEERHKAEVRRAVNDELLATVNKRLVETVLVQCVRVSCFRLCGSDTSHSWEREGRRIVPVLPRAVARTGLTPAAQSAAETLAKQNSALLRPCDTRTPAPLPPLPAPEHLLTTRHQPAPVVTVPHPDLGHQHSSYNGVSDKRSEAGSDETGVVVLPSGTVVRVSAPAVSSRGQNKRGAGKRRRSSTARSKNIEVFSGGLAQLAAAAEAHADLSPPRKIPSILGAGHGYARPLPSSSPLPDRQVVLPPDSAGGGRRGPGRPPGPASPGVMQVVQGRGRPRLVSGGGRGRGGRPRGGVLITPRLSSPQSVSSSPVSAAAALLVPHSSTGHVLHGSPIVTTARLALRPTTVTVASPRATTIQLKQEQTSLTNPALQGLKVISHSNTKIVPKSATAVYVVPNSSGGTQRILTNASTALPGVIKTVRTGAGGKPSVIVLQKGAGLPTVSGGVAVYRPVQTTDSSGAVQAVYRPARARVVSGSQVSGAAGNNLFVLNMTKQQQTTAATTTSQEKLEG